MREEYSNNCFEYLKKYLDYMWVVKGKSENTINEYYTDLRTLFRFLKVRKNLVDKDIEFDKIMIDDIDLDFIKSISLEDLYEFMGFASNSRKNSTTTRARKTSSIKNFFNYLDVKIHVLEINPAKELEAPKKKKTLPKYLTLEQSLELLNAVDGDYKERDYCILTLFLNCGIRLAELVSINLGDIDLQERTLRIVGKGDKERQIYINDACVSAVKAYMKIRNPDKTKDKKALFISRQSGRISNKTVQAMVYKYLKKIGLENKGYSVHKLRHTAATLMYQHGKVDIRILKDILGHENLGTTEIYTHVSDENMKDASNKNPLSGVIKKK